MATKIKQILDLAGTDTLLFSSWLSAQGINVRKVPKTLLYGGKLAAALSRQHPRDLFDVKYMDVPLTEVREGFLLCLLGSDRPIHESFAPRLIDQQGAMANQFEGMTDIVFTYEEFEETRAQLIEDVKALMTDADKQFLLSFETGEPMWDGYEFAYFQNYPSVQWKLLNLQKLKKQNPAKLQTMDSTGLPTILIVDDEPDIREILCFNLEQAGYRCHAGCGTW